MARQHAILLTTIWEDDDFLQLSGAAQRVFLLLISQPKLSRAGMLDLFPSRWARLAVDTSADDIDRALDELEASRFVLIDRATDELVVRTHVKHEATSDKVANGRWLTGLWSAWSTIASRQLQDAVLNEIPASVWDSPKGKPPAEARNRRSASKLPAERSSRTDRQNVPQEPGTRNQEPASKPTSGEPAPDPGPAAAANDHDQATDQDQPSVLDQAIDQLTDRELQRNPSRGNPARHRAAVHRGKTRDHQAQASQLLTDRPDLDAETLADLLEPPPTPPTAGTWSPPRSEPGVRHDIADEAETERQRQERQAVPADPEANVSRIDEIRNARLRPQDHPA